MWRTGLLYLDRGDSPLMAALRDSNYNQQTSPVSPTRRMSVSSNAESVRSESRTRQEISKQAMQSWMVPPEAASGIKFGSRVKVDDAVDQLSSPMSEMGLSEEPSSYALDRIREDDAPPGYFSYEDGEQSVNGDDEKQMQVARSRPRHSRTPSSTPSTPISPTARMSRMMPARAKTSEGLLQLQANPAKAQRPTGGHQRKVSLGLPIRSPTAPTAEVKQNKSKASKRLSVSEVLPQPTRPKRSTSVSMVQQERELEYLHRHTFVGTASLDDFLEVLEVSPEHTTTKSAIINAFLLLASSERQLARQASVKPSGWGLVSKTINETCDVDYVEQAHAKLGSIVLRQFLDLISFDEDEVASAMSVVEAFSASSYLDTKANSALSSKAKAFRCWMVTQNAGKA